MTNDQEKTEETPLTVEMFRGVIDCMGSLGLTHVQLKTMCAVARLMDKALCDMLEARATPTPSHPEAKYKTGQWFIYSDSPTPWRLVTDGQWLDNQADWAYDARNVDDAISWPLEKGILPIPPKPSTVQPGYRITGVVKVADGSEPYVHSGMDHMVHADGIPAALDVFDGRRWIAKLDPALRACPVRWCEYCGQKLVAHENAKCPKLNRELPI